MCVWGVCWILIKSVIYNLCIRISPLDRGILRNVLFSDLLRSQNQCVDLSSAQTSRHDSKVCPVVVVSSSVIHRRERELILNRRLEVKNRWPWPFLLLSLTLFNFYSRQKSWSCFHVLIRCVHVLRVINRPHQIQRGQETVLITFSNS